MLKSKYYLRLLMEDHLAPITDERKGGMQGFCGFAYDSLERNAALGMHSTRAEVVLAPVLSKPTSFLFIGGSHQSSPNAQTLADWLSWRAIELAFLIWGHTPVQHGKCC